MSDNLTLKEHLLIEETIEDRKRRPDLKYTEKIVKNQIDRVIVELNGNESGALTKLADRYDRLSKAIKLMGIKKDELNSDIKSKVEDLFAAEDIILTRVIETVSFTLTVSKKSKVEDKVIVDYKAIAEGLAKMIPDELQSKVEEVKKAYTTIALQADKSPALSVKANVTEGIIGTLTSAIISTIKKTIKSIMSWSTDYNKKLNALKKIANI